MKLTKKELEILKEVNSGKTSFSELKKTGFDSSTLNTVSIKLEEKDLVEINETENKNRSLTPEGEKYAEIKLPEIRMYREILEESENGKLPRKELVNKTEIDEEELEIAIANFARKNYGSIEQGKISASKDVSLEEDKEQSAIERIKEGLDEVEDELLKQLERRNLIETKKIKERNLTLTEKCEQLDLDEVETDNSVGRLTSEMLSTGKWKTANFSGYNVEAEAGSSTGGKKHILRQTADRVKDVLVGMGFEEMEGPHADSEFWINDCLFMPQDHPARTHWDQFGLDVPNVENLPSNLVKKVRSAHLNGVGKAGDGYHSPWNEEMAKEVDLRGHTTSLTMRHLSGYQKGDIEPPARYFSVEKVYRNDTIDSTHLLEFFQIEGWVMAENLSVRDLMGTFKEFYAQFGIHDIKFKPHYNPYTEPSFELFGKHPKTGELIEIGNSGIFRDEVLEPLGVECDVMAWGLALERLLMLMYGFEDIRDVHGTLCDLKLLKDTEVMY